MMYGFGDVQKSHPGSVALMEEIMLEYMVGLVTKAATVAQSRGRDKPDIADVMFVVRKNPRKLERVRYLQEMNRTVQKAKGSMIEEVVDENTKK
mmetsp:Transcript_33283/g.81659  ORF Transcript_33283/g.81659 Transcript_33283/m.81659 type:complete len:94 (+) Transcript_33283:53-334(+)